MCCSLGSTSPFGACGPEGQTLQVVTHSSVVPLHLSSALLQKVGPGYLLLAPHALLLWVPSSGYRVHAILCYALLLGPQPPSWEDLEVSVPVGTLGESTSSSLLPSWLDSEFCAILI